MNKGQARRLNSSRTSRRSRWLGPLSLVCGVFSALVPVYVVRVLTNPQALPVAHVEVLGNFHYLDTRKLSQRVAELTTGSFITLDVSAVRAALMEEPWVADAVVKRVWPDRIEVTLHEHDPVARWGADGLLSREAIAFHPPLTEFANSLVLLDGPAGTEHEVLSQLGHLQSLLLPLGKPLQSLRLNERGAWSFRLAAGPEVIVGRTDFDARIERFVATFGNALAHRNVQVEEVDLRYTNGFAVRFATPEVRKPVDPRATALKLSP